MNLTSLTRPKWASMQENLSSVFPRTQYWVRDVSDQVILKPASSATETSHNREISLVASYNTILSNKRITKGLIRLCSGAGWSAPVLFANPQRQVFSRRGTFDIHILQIMCNNAGDMKVKCMGGSREGGQAAKSPPSPLLPPENHKLQYVL